MIGDRDKNIGALIESFRVEVKELKQDFERYKEIIATTLTNMFNKLLTKIEELEKSGK